MTEAPLTAGERKDLEGKLLERLRRELEKSRNIGYLPHPFVAMISDHRPVGACIRVITKEPPPEGFAKLWELDHLELTAERAILDGPWCHLFPTQVRERAKRRLRQYKRPDLIPSGFCF